MKKRYSVFLTLAILLFWAVDSANASLDRYYPFETEIGGITPDIAGGIGGTLVGYPTGGSIVTDSGGVAPHNGRVKKAENVLNCIPWGGMYSTYSGFTGQNDTIAIWFKTDGEWIQGVDNWNALFSSNGTYELQVGGNTFNGTTVPLADGYVQSFSYTGGNSWVITQTAYDDGDWHHLVRTFGPYNPADNACKVYIDGILVASGPAPGAAPSGDTFRIGMNSPSGYADYFKGRIDNVRAYSQVLTASKVWNLYVSETNELIEPLPQKPISPSPGDGSINQSLETDMSWSDGGDATSYDVYFGTDSTPDSGEFKGNQSGLTYDPGALTNDTTYYWRIDAKNSSGTTTGDVWSFTTGNGIEENLVAWYQFDADASDTMGNYNGTFGYGVSVVYDGQRGSNVMNCTGSNYAMVSPYVMPTGPATVAMWFKTTQPTANLFQSGSPAGAKDIYIGGSKAPNGAVGSFVWAGGPGSWITSPESNYNDGQWHHLARVIGSSIYSDHVIYIDGTEVARQVGVGPDNYGANNVYIGGSANFATVNFIGRIDGLRFYNSVLLPEKVRELAGMAGRASNPYPKEDYYLAKEISQSLKLQWTSGIYAQSVNGHKVYFGTNESAVANRDPGVYKGAQSQTNYSTGPLEYETTYYWAIDEVNDSTVPYTWPGEVWSFTTTFKDPKKPTLYYLHINDFGQVLSAKQQYDLRHIAICVQGLANRQAPRVFIRFIPEDETWWTRLRESGGLCEGWPIVNVNNMQELITIFRSHINGVVLYNPDPGNGVNSTSHVASVVAGVEGGIAVRKDTASGSMYNYLVNDINGPQLPVLFDLTDKFTGSGTIWQTSTPSTGSAKCDAYIWAKEKYIDTGKCDPTTVFYTLDMYGLKIIPNNPNRWQLTNLDYMIRRKGFVFDLSPWLDEPATDDPTQPSGTDGQTFRKLLDACNNQTQKQKMIKWMAFQDCEYKYSDAVGGSHGFWETLPEVDIISNQYNCYTEPDAPGINYVSNSSFYAGLKTAVCERRPVQNPAPTYNDMISRGLINGSGNVPAGNYVMIFMGDYDNASWTLYWCAGQRYDDYRGQNYLTWAINPTSLDRVPVALDYMYRHKTSKDYFVAPNSGAGWVMPTWLYNRTNPAYSLYPSIIPVWQKHCRNYYRLVDYSISGWLLDGLGHTMTTTDAVNYAPFSGDGIGMYVAYSGPNPTLVNNSPVIVEAGVDPTQSGVINYSSGVHFAFYRTILAYPNNIADIEDQYVNSGHNHRFLDAYTFYYLMRYYMGGTNNYRATWVSDTIPRIMAANQTYSVTVTIRNDGWDTWSEANLYRLGHAIVSPGVIPVYADYDPTRHYLPTGTTVTPGQTVTFSFNLTAPSTNGNYDLYYDMVRDGYTWFRTQNNIEWKKEIIVVTNETDVDTDGDGIPDVTEEVNGTLYWHPDDTIRKKNDFEPDGDVDISDFMVMAEHWLQDYPPADIAPENPDGIIDLLDFSVLAQDWLYGTEL